MARNLTKAEILSKIEELKLLVLDADDSEVDVNRGTETVNIHFTEREIARLPKSVKQWLRAKGGVIKARKRTNRGYVCSYEMRYHRNGYKISASSTAIPELKEHFIEKINAAAMTYDSNVIPKIPTNFDKFTLYWLENFHRRKVQFKTYSSSIALYNRHIKSKFGNLSVKDINPVMLQNFLDSFSDRGKTADDIHSLFNQIFKAAVNHGLITLNPLGMVFHKQHKRKHGKAISKVDEKLLLSTYVGTPYQFQFAIALYTGLRPNEWATAVLDGDFIKAKNSKRKDGEMVFKRIPITPMLRPYFDGLTGLPIPINPNELKKKFKSVLPEHKLYDMRTTFQTRCTESGISDIAIGLFMGNSIGGKLKEAYTDISDEYLIKEGQKLKY